MSGSVARWIIGSILLAAGLFRTASVLPERIGQHDFAHYFTGSRAFLRGESPYTLDLKAEYERLGFSTKDPGWTQGATNPPTLQALFAPFAALAPEAAFWSWSALQLAALVAVAGLSAAIAGLGLSGAVLVLGILTMSNAVFQHFWFGQTQLLVLALVLAGAWLALRGRELAGGAIFAVGASLKLFPLAILPWLIWRSRRRARAMVGAGVVLGILALALWPLWKDFFAYGLPVVADNAVGQWYNYTVPGLVLNAMVVTGFIPPAPFTVASTLGLLALVAVYAGLAFQESGDPAAELAGLLPAAIAASLVAWPHYWVFLAPALAVLISRQIATERRMYVVALLAMSAVLFVVGVPLFARGPLDSVRWLLIHYVPLFVFLGLAGMIMYGAPVTEEPARQSSRDRYRRAEERPSPGATVEEPVP